jgi:hypothetical protein
MVRGRDPLARQWPGWEAERFRYLSATAPPGLLIIRRGKLSIEMLTITRRTLVLAVVANHRVWLAAPLLATAAALASCAALQPPSATGPRGNEPLYPILFTADSHRKESIAVALKRLAVQAGNSNPTEAQLQPVTATILNISPKANGNLYLAKVGATAVMTEEETRESLRRFIKEWQELIGADPSKLSLVERVDQPDGSKLANYEQRPFRYPIRGNYGRLQIRFNVERRVLNLTSSCIPDADRIQTALAALSVHLKAEDAVQLLRENGVAYSDPQGTRLNFKVPAASEITPRGLVTYILASKETPDALEFHLAWEMELSNAPIKIAFIDAITGETVAAE